MRRTFLALSLVLALSASLATAQTIGAVLTGSQERPTPVTTNGFGNFTGTFDATRSNLTITLTVANLTSSITGAHIHEKNPGSDTGSVKINFNSSSFSGGKLTGTFPVPASDATLFNRIIANPANFYVNVHTTNNPNGEIRGELTESGTIIQYAAELRGANEVPPNSSTNFGSALITIDTAANTLTYQVASTVANATLSHIHGPGGNPGTNASVFIGFTNPTGGKTSGTVSTSSLDATNFAKLLNNPGEFYVNVHSPAFGGGEIRGQLVPVKEAEIPVAGKVGTFVTDARVFNPSYDTPATAMLEFFPSGTSANATAANVMVVNIPPRGTATLNDVTGSSNLNATAPIGAIRVSSAAVFNASSKIFSDLRSTNQGTLGQFTPGLPRSGALRRGVLTQLEQDADFRTNLGFFNPNNAAVTVRLELRDDAGNLVGQSTQTFQALAHTQQLISNFFPGVDFSNQPKLTLSFDASAPMDVYAAVNDNKSTDAFVVVPQEDTGVGANQ
jgi:hypothetical protein